MCFTISRHSRIECVQAVELNPYHEERGITPKSLVKDFTLVSGSELAGLFCQYDQVWHW